MKKEHEKTRIVAIDLIRGVSILYIVGYWHLFNYTDVYPGYVNVVTSRLTIIVLGLFVLISGYLISAEAIPPNKDDILIFYKTRLLRIYPPFIFAIILFYVLGISDGITLVKSAALISMFSPPAPATLWFVTMLVIFYIIAPLLINMSGSFSIGKYILFCLLMITATYAVFANFMDIRFAMYFPAFATGVLLSRRGYLLYKINPTVIALLLIAAIAISSNNIALISTDVLSTPLILVGSLLIFVLAMRINGKIRQHWSISLLSYASLFMYLFHRPLFKIFVHLYFPISGAYQILYLLVICLPLIVAISWLGQKVYDLLVLQLTKYITQEP